VRRPSAASEFIGNAMRCCALAAGDDGKRRMKLGLRRLTR